MFFFIFASHTFFLSFFLKTFQDIYIFVTQREILHNNNAAAAGKTFHTTTHFAQEEEVIKYVMKKSITLVKRNAVVE